MTYFDFIGNVALSTLVVALMGTVVVWFVWCYKMLKD